MSSDATLNALRRRLHAAAELSGEEEETASILIDELESLAPDRILKEIGGHGIAAVFAGEAAGETLLLRADMDALPLADDEGLSHRARRAGVAHRCGHDGHMASVMGVAKALAAEPIERGRVVLLFQPAEETGAGARAVLDDEQFAEITPDLVLGQHNLPGYPLGTVVLREGVFASASCGIIAEFQGQASHASEPNLGRSPLFALTQFAQQIVALPQACSALHEGAQVTVVGIEMGGENFGTSPGEGRVMATLRAHEAQVMETLRERSAELARALAHAQGLECVLSWVDDFPSTASDAEVVRELEQAAEGLGLPVARRAAPFPWSEDFGHFTAAHRGAFFGMGAGEKQPSLHAPRYDFPDDLIAPTSAMMLAIVRAHLGKA